MSAIGKLHFNSRGMEEDHSIQQMLEMVVMRVEELFCAQINCIGLHNDIGAYYRVEEEGEDIGGGNPFPEVYN